jgi:crossover junction endodeoxyribonuclease RusA
MAEPRTVNLILPMPPSSNRYWRTMVTKRGIAVTYVSEEAKIYKQLVKDIAGIDTLIYSDVAVTVKVFRARRAGDFHNRRKVLYDALQGVVYVDDKQIVEDHGFRFEDPKHPRVEVEIKVLGLL